MSTQQKEMTCIKSGCLAACSICTGRMENKGYACNEELRLGQIWFSVPDMMATGHANVGQVVFVDDILYLLDTWTKRFAKFGTKNMYCSTIHTV
jgi:hypothetical protein